MKYSPRSEEAARTTDAQLIKTTIESFLEDGESGPHSILGTTLCYVTEYCYNHGIAYTLKFVPCKGYYLRRGVEATNIPEFLHDLWELK